MSTKDFQQPAEVINDFNQSGKIFTPDPLDSKSSFEFQRYKQDCRKRAVDLAMSNCGIGNPTPDDVMKMADKYYNWLISIPE